MTDVVIEWAPFRLMSGKSESELLAASERLQREFLEQQNGFLRRELVRGSDGQYADLVWWRDAAAAAAVIEKAGESSICHAFFSLMEMDDRDPGAGVLHFTRLRTYNAG